MVYNEALSRSAVEVLAFLDNVSDDIYNKISSNFINYLKDIQSFDYYFEYDVNKSLEEQNFSKEALKMIGLIYKDYICDENEKKEYIDFINQYEISKEKEKQEKYSYENLFKKEELESSKVEEKPQETAMIEYKKESYIIRLLNKIKSIFKKEE